MSDEIAVGDLRGRLPEKWRIDHQDDREVVLVFPVQAGPTALSAKPTATFMGSLLIEIVPGEGDLDLLVQDRIEKFQKAQPTCTKVLESSGTVAGVPARFREHTFTGPGRMLYQQRVAYLVLQNTAYILSTTHLAGAQFSPVRRSFDGFLTELRATQ